MILQGSYHLMGEITIFQMRKIKLYKMLQLGKTTSGWWAGGQGNILGVNATWDKLFRVCRCGSQMGQGRALLEEGPVWAKAWRWENTTGNIKAQKGSSWGWQWGLVVWGAQTPLATATLGAWGGKEVTHKTLETPLSSRQLCLMSGNDTGPMWLSRTLGQSQGKKRSLIPPESSLRSQFYHLHGLFPLLF